MESCRNGQPHGSDVVNFDVELGDLGNPVGEPCLDPAFGKPPLDERGELSADRKALGLVFKSIFVASDAPVPRNDGFGLPPLRSLLSLLSGFLLPLSGNTGLGEFRELSAEADRGDLDFEPSADDDLLW